MSRRAWELARRQHGVVSLAQLLRLGYTRHAIEHRLKKGRLHRVHRGVYAVGRRELTREGEWMAAVLACGEGAALSGDSAAALWEIRARQRSPIEIAVPGVNRSSPKGIRVRRCRHLPSEDITTRRRIPVTAPLRTLIDLASRLDTDALEAAINEADKLDLIDPHALGDAVHQRRNQRGARVLRRLLDRQTFTATRSWLERRFVPIARRAGLPKPLTQQCLNGYEVDFHWPELGLIVETDGGRFHRTAAQQTADRRRDQAHLSVGMTPLRFTHAQVKYEPDYVEATLRSVASQLRAAP